MRPQIPLQPVASAPSEPPATSPRSHVQAPRRGWVGSRNSRPFRMPGVSNQGWKGQQVNPCFGTTRAARSGGSSAPTAFPAAGACPVARRCAGRRGPGRETVRLPQRAAFSSSRRPIVMASRHRATVGCPCRGCSPPGDPIGRGRGGSAARSPYDRFVATRPCSGAEAMRTCPSTPLPCFRRSKQARCMATDRVLLNRGRDERRSGRLEALGTARWLRLSQAGLPPRQRI